MASAIDCTAIFDKSEAYVYLVIVKSVLIEADWIDFVEALYTTLEDVSEHYG